MTGLARTEKRAMINDSKNTEARIREDIMALAPSRRSQMLRWLVEMDRRDWDHQLEEDFSDNGPGAALLRQVQADFRAGHCKKWK